MAILYFNTITYYYSTIRFLHNKVAELLQRKDWPQTALILIPLITGFGRIYQKEFTSIKSNSKDIQHLKILIIEKWNQMPQEQINRGIDQFRKRLKKAIQVSGTHIDY